MTQTSMATFTESQIPTTGIGTSNDLPSVEENTNQTSKTLQLINHNSLQLGKEIFTMYTWSLDYPFQLGTENFTM